MAALQRSGLWRDKAGRVIGVVDAAEIGDDALARAARSRVYGKARRHSARVRFLRRAIPIGAVLAIGLIVVTFFDPFGRLSGLKIGPISMSGSRIAMEAPRLSGYRKDNRGYEVTADAAYQDIRKPTVIELARMKARLAMDDSGKVANLTAATGIFDTQREQLELRQDIHVTTSDGQEAFLISASVDFKAGTVVSTEPVKVNMTGATVEADGMTVTENGKTVTFTGRVHVLMERAAEGPAKPAKAVQSSAPAPTRAAEASR